MHTAIAAVIIRSSIGTGESLWKKSGREPTSGEQRFFGRI